MHYLTVPDLLWINLQLTGSPQAYDYATLEEATFYQYSRGDSSEILTQAARFLTGFNRLAPFADGNVPTGFIGCLAYLEANGHTLDLDDSSAGGWLQGALVSQAAATQAVRDKMRDYSGHSRFGVPDTHEIVDGLLLRYEQTLDSLKSVAV